MNIRYFSSIMSLSFLIFFCVACQPSNPTSQPNPTQNPLAQGSSGMVKNVHVKMTNPEKNEGEIESFPLPNCGGTGELTQSLGTQASVSKSVTLGGRAKTKAGGEVAIPQTAKLQLELEIEAAYQQTYETANARLDSIEMNAAAKTHVVYEILWEKQDFSSIVTYEMDGQIFEAPYSYVLRVPKIKNSFQEICPTGGVASIPTTSQPVPPNTPVPKTPPTATSVNCENLVTSSRSLQVMDTGNRCWLKLFDGDSAELIFNQPAQVTFAIGDGRGDRYFFIANPGDKLSDVYGATIRSISFVNLQYGGIEQVREFEITYHNPGGGFPTCLRDWNNSNSPMTSLCQ